MNDAATAALLASKDAQIAALMQVTTQQATLLTQQSAIIDQQGVTIKQQGDLITSLRGGAVTPITNNEIYAAFEKAHKTAPSWKSMRNCLRPFIAEFGPLPAMSTTPKMWAKLREKLKVTETEKTGKPLSPLTINFVLGWAKSMYNWASEEEQGLIPSNPLAKAKAEQVDSERDTWLTMVEVNKLLEHFGDHWMSLFIVVSISTGLRQSEVLRIRKDKIKRFERPDGTVGVIELSKRINKTKKTYYASLPPTAIEAIDRAPPSVNPHIIPSPYRPGRPMGKRHVARLFREGCERTGIDYRAAEGDGHVRCHDVRHSAGTLAAQNGATLPQVQRMLNHTTPVHTVRYLHYDETDAVNFALLMEGAVRKGPHSTTLALYTPASKATAE